MQVIDEVDHVLDGAATGTSPEPLVDIVVDQAIFEDELHRPGPITTPV